MSKRASPTGNPFSVLRKLRKTNSLEPVAKESSTVSISSTTPNRSTFQCSMTINVESTSRDQMHSSTVSIPANGMPLKDLACQTVSSSNMDLTLLLLDSNQSVSIQGFALVSAVLGSCRVFGYTMHGPFKWDTINTSKPVHPIFVKVFSPASSSRLQIENVSLEYLNLQTTHLTDSGHASAADKELNMHVEIMRLVKTIPNKQRQSISCIVAMQRSKTNIEKIERYLPIFQNLFDDGVPKKSNNVFSIPDESTLKSVDALIIPDTWALTASSLLVNSFTHNSNICAVGPKNSGKSTFTRYLINRFLERHSEVAYMDCDPGQPGCTPNGMVSLHVINSPLLGPAFTTQRDSYRSFFIGSTAPKDDPDFFSACVLELVNVWQTELIKMPLIVNTNGWIKGTGYDLLAHFLRYLLPTDIVHLSLASQADSTTEIDFKSIFPVQHSFDIWKIKPAPSDALSKIKLNASDQRVLTTISYFMRHATLFKNQNTQIEVKYKWDLDTPLTSRIPYSVPWNHVRIKFFSEDISFSQALYALNGTVVGLLVDQTKYQTTLTEQCTSNETYLQIVPTQSLLHPHNHHCIGLGIIRSIDPRQKQFYIVSPLPLHHLNKVNLIVRSAGLDLPVCLITDGYQNSRKHLPYTTYIPAEGVGAVAIRNRHLQRRGLVNAQQRSGS
ncbi:Polynucleotide 5'-hydroxyl-kinase grc3 [Batrachochytrium dendrobatidis]